MYKNKAKNGRLNICGEKVTLMRKSMLPKVSQQKFSDLLFDYGLDLDKNAIQRIEAGKRFVTDIELKVISKVLNCSSDYLLE